VTRGADAASASPSLPADSDWRYRLQQSVEARKKLERLKEVLTTPGHAGVGASPHEVVHRENKLRLLRLLGEDGEPRTGPPVLFVSAPVSRYFVLDLLPGRSFVGTVAQAGFDVYLIDFGEPDQADRFADIDYYVNQLIRHCVRRIAAITGESAPNLLGYCLGGTLALLYTALHPDTVSRLALLTTTVDGDVKGGIPWTAHCLGLSGESFDDPRLVPANEVKSWFEMLAPGSNSLIGRVTDLWNRLDEPVERLRDIRTMATWVDDVVPAPGRLLAELYGKFGPGRNGLMNGSAEIGGRPIDLTSVTVPVLSISAGKDTIAPPEGVDAIHRVIPHAQIVRMPGGHVGIVAGRSAKALWETTIDFLHGKTVVPDAQSSAE
jgi:polyhydroxyalkanoate synthase